MSDAERRRDELDALVAIFERVDVVSDATARVTLRDDDDEDGATTTTCRADIHMPDAYPSTAPLEVTSIESDALSRDARAMLLADVRAFALGAIGEESAYGALTMIEDGFRRAVGERRLRDAADADARRRREECAEIFHAVIRIDHMNDSVGYLKSLGRWCDAEGLGCRVFHKPPTDENGKRRVEGVFVALSGSNEGIKSFAQRLRTEFVDVDRHGVKCKERKSTVLAHRKNSTVKEGERAVEAFEGFETMPPYETEEDLERGLASLNVLHVGDGSQRFV
jgi:solute carrier family 25 carnitine/acylcarnitine transporter 20/29